MLKSCVVGFILLLLPAITMASTTTSLLNDEYYAVGEGDLETRFSIGSTFLRGDVSAENFRFQIGGNYFINDTMAPGVDILIADVGGTEFRIFPHFKMYFFKEGRLLPYALAGLGFTHLPNTNGFDFGLGFGVNYLISNTVAIGVGFQYDYIAGDLSVSRVEIPVGFSLFFRF